MAKRLTLISLVFLPLLLTGCMRFEVNFRVLGSGDGSLEVVTQFNPEQANDRYRELRGTDFSGFSPGAESAICGEVFTDPAGAAAIPGGSVEQVFADGWCVERFTVNFAASDNPGQVLANAGLPGWNVQRSGDEWQFDYAYSGPSSRLRQVNTRGLTPGEIQQALADTPITVNVTMPGSPITSASNADSSTASTLSWTRSVASPQSFSARSSLTGATEARPTPVPADDPVDEDPADEGQDAGAGAGDAADGSASEEAADAEGDEGSRVAEDPQFATGTDTDTDTDTAADTDDDAVVDPSVTSGGEAEPADARESADELATEADTEPAAEEPIENPGDSTAGDGPDAAGVIEVNTRSGPSRWSIAALVLGALIFGLGLLYALRRGPDRDRSGEGTSADGWVQSMSVQDMSPGFEDGGQLGPTGAAFREPGADPFGLGGTSASPFPTATPDGSSQPGSDPFSAWPVQATPPVASTATAAATTSDPVMPDAQSGLIDASTIRWDEERRLWVSHDPAAGSTDFDPDSRDWKLIP